MSACTGNNLRGKARGLSARGLSPRTGGQTIVKLLHTIHFCLLQPDEDEAEMEQLTDYRIHPTGVIMAHKNTISQAANKICEGSAVEWAYLSKESGKCAIIIKPVYKVHRLLFMWSVLKI